MNSLKDHYTEGPKVLKSHLSDILLFFFSFLNSDLTIANCHLTLNFALVCGPFMPQQPVGVKREFIN